MTIKLTIQKEGPYTVARSTLLARAKKMLHALSLAEAELSILLTGDKHIQQLNRTYRGMDKPTDVLAFALREGEFGHLAKSMLGDVIISMPTAYRQAAKAGHSLLEEVTLLLAHGLLHLLGWDHQTKAEDQKMRKEVTRLCALSQVRSPFVL